MINAAHAAKYKRRKIHDDDDERFGTIVTGKADLRRINRLDWASVGAELGQV
jgi:hypothetical protein